MEGPKASDAFIRSSDYSDVLATISPQAIEPIGDIYANC
jgi:hypothetical protein